MRVMIVAALGAWRGARGGAVSPELFRRDILPRLRQLPVRRIARAIGVSPGYASFIRRGLRVPHRRHFEALRKLFQQEGDETMTTR